MNKVEVNVPDEFLEKLYTGDSRCKYPVGTKVIKSGGEEKDHHKVGERGVVKGSVFLEKSKERDLEEDVEAYIVTFQGDTDPTLILGEKLEQNLFPYDI